MHCKCVFRSSKVSLLEILEQRRNLTTSTAWCLQYSSSLLMHGMKARVSPSLGLQTLSLFWSGGRGSEGKLHYRTCPVTFICDYFSTPLNYKGETHTKAVGGNRSDWTQDS